MENSAHLLGIPLVAVGVVGTLVTLALLLGSVRLTTGSLTPGQAPQAHLFPGSTVWPFVVVMGGPFTLAGLVSHVSLLGVGLAISGLGVLGWLAEDITRHRSQMRGGGAPESGPHEEAEGEEHQGQA